MKALKFIGFGLLALLVLVVLAASVLAWRFDPAWAKQQLTQSMQEKKQRTLKIDGDLAISFYPSIGVRLGRASLSERNSPQEFASIDKARVSVRVLPLLSRRLVVDRIELDGLRARIVRDKNGRFNFDDLVSGEPGDRKPPTATPEGTPITFDVAGAGITRSAVTFQDQGSGRTLEITELNASTGRLSQAASGPLQLAFRVDSPQPPLKAAVKAGGNYRYDLARKQYAVEKLDLQVQGDAFGFNALDAAVKAKDAAWAGAPGGMEVEALAITAKGKRDADTLDARFELPRVRWSAGQTGGQAGTGHIRLAGPQRQFDAQLDLRGIQAAADTLKFDDVAVRWTLKQAALSAQGHAAGALQADLNAKVLAAPKLGGEMHITHPGLPMKDLTLPLDASLRVDWARSQAEVKLSTRIEDSAVQGKFAVAKFSPLDAGFDLAIDKLDIDRYVPEAAPAHASTPASAPKAATEKPIDFAFLRGLALNGTLKVGSMKAHNLRFSNVSGRIAVKNGRMDLNPLSASLYGGSLTGSASAQADGNRIALKQTMDNVAIGPLVRDYAHKDILEGHGQLALDVSAAGTSAAAMRQSLNGVARVSLRDGAVKGIDLAKTLRQGKALLAGGKQDQVVAANKTEKTDFSEMSASFRIANGMARNDDLSAKSPFLRVAGAGNIDLVHEQLDYLAKVTVVASTKGQEGKELADLNGLTIPVRLTGPYDSPSYHLEFGALATELAKQQVRKKLEQRLETELGSKKGLGEALKGLIK